MIPQKGFQLFVQILGQLYSDTTKVDLIVKLSIQSDLATIWITGPDGKWFGVGFGAKTFTMSDQPYTIMVDGSGNISELRKGQTLAKSVQILGNKGHMDNLIRHIKLTRSKEVFNFEIFRFSLPVQFEYVRPTLRTEMYAPPSKELCSKMTLGEVGASLP
jgi:hypothetical protein